MRENNLYLSQTIVYNYDNGGNLTSRKIYPYTEAEDISDAVIEDEIRYSYDGEWKDQLKNYDGETITYDEIGNPLIYWGKTLEWTGRTLDRLEQTGTAISYRYDASGLRTGKTVGSEETQYYYSDGLLAYEKRGTKEFYYQYDSEGKLSVIEYSDGTGLETYYPAVNSRGDVEAIYNAQGVLQARYIYDSWGEIISVLDDSGAEITDQNHIGHLNTIRYRGYYYDAETGFYYVSSRYYDPEVGRFISADTTDILEVQSDLYDKNLYAYCDNNPVVRVDSDGEFWNIATGAVIGAAISMATQVVDNALAGNSLTEGLLTAAVGGMITGGLAASGANVIIQSLVSGVVSGVSDYVSQAKNNGKSNVNYMQVGVSTAIGIASGVYGGNGVRHKKGEVAKAKKVYDYAVDGIKSRKWTSNKGSTYLKSASKNYRKTLNSAVKFAYGRYRNAAVAGIVAKRSYLTITKI